MLHADVKPDNILLAPDKGIFKLGDLGQAAMLSTWDESSEGDSRYLSRDLLQSEPTASADIFSFGITLLEVCSGKSLPGVGAEWERLRADELPVEWTLRLADTDPLLVSLMTCMMRKKAAARPAAPAVVDTAVQATSMVLDASRQALASRLLPNLSRRGSAALELLQAARRIPGRLSSPLKSPLASPVALDC